MIVDIDEKMWTIEFIIKTRFGATAINCFPFIFLRLRILLDINSSYDVKFNILQFHYSSLCFALLCNLITNGTVITFSHTWKIIEEISTFYHNDFSGNYDLKPNLPQMNFITTRKSKTLQDQKFKCWIVFDWNLMKSLCNSFVCVK